MDSEVHMFQHFVAASVQLIGATRNVVSVRLNASHSFLYSPHSHRIAICECVCKWDKFFRRRLSTYLNRKLIDQWHLHDETYKDANAPKITSLNIRHTYAINLVFCWYTSLIIIRSRDCRPFLTMFCIGVTFLPCDCKLAKEQNFCNKFEKCL